MWVAVDEIVERTVRSGSVRPWWTSRPRTDSAKPESGAWRLSSRARPGPGFAKPWRTSGGTATKVPGPARCGPSSSRNSTTALQHVEGVHVVRVRVLVDPEAGLELDLRWPTAASKSALITSVRSLRTNCSPSPGPSTTASMRAAYELRRAARPLGVLVPRRRLPAGGARGARRRARVRGARAHRPRRRLRLARVRARGQGARRPSDHRRRGDAGGRRPRHPARRDGARLLESLPAAHGGARRHEAQGGSRPAAAGAPARRAGRAHRRPRLPLRLRAARTRAARPERRGPARPARSAATASSSSSSARTSAATRAGSRRSATWPRRSASTRSRPATRTRTIRGGSCSRTCSSPSATAPRSTAASASAAATARASCWPPARWPTASRAIRARSPAPPSSPTASASTSPSELGYRYPDFSDGEEPADVQLARVCDRARSPTATGAKQPQCYRVAREAGSTRSWR